ncbi:MAG: hypothetical protein ACK4EZ_02050 [Fervidobacterium pennivorans]|uniref:Uncharacterized protein n=2 Tax=Fervidobacterium TaxID=2422 RepID=A0AAI8CKS6_FERIS|nr:MULTISPECIES: hypothetical protein [Fervidobacterium]AMW32393.1 hypothetical protein NA23_03170 [Fervidobacterium islandicum]QAV34026.1 hypothetical protein CBS1_10190 [Fervidobacterium changbaicum]SDH37667.1 hypothetical protein SAMN04488510_11216 [Fervidobacterium changbaicum]
MSTSKISEFLYDILVDEASQHFGNDSEIVANFILELLSYYLSEARFSESNERKLLEKVREKISRFVENELV